MKLEQLITLINAGYTKDEISAMLQAEHPEPTPEPTQEPKPEPKPEPTPEPKKEPEQDPIKALQAELKSLRDEIHKSNIAKSEQPKPRSVDEILAEAMKGGR
jgi:hypothetical protein